MVANTFQGRMLLEAYLEAAGKRAEIDSAPELDTPLPGRFYASRPLVTESGASGPTPHTLTQIVRYYPSTGRGQITMTLECRFYAHGTKLRVQSGAMNALYHKETLN